MTPEIFQHEFFETHYGICNSALKYVDIPVTSAIDAGAGKGVWGEAFRDVIGWSSFLTGIEIRETEHNPVYDNWITGDYLNNEFINLDTEFHDLVFGNPPFSLAVPFVEKSYELIHEGGYVLFLLRIAILAGQKRGNLFWPNYTPKKVLVLSKRPSFTGNGVTDIKTEYAVILWQKGYKGDPTLGWLKWQS